MSDVPRLRVPDPHVGPLRQFAELPDERVEPLLAILGEDPPIVNRDDLERRVHDAVPELTLATDLIEALMAIDVVRTSHGWSAEQVAEGVSKAAELELGQPMRERFAERLTKALGLPSLSANAKALDVMTAHERFLHISRIVTDMRPIFGEAADAPVAAIVSHSLELTYYRASGRIESLFIGLDDEALRRLGQTVRRAEQKSRSLRAFLNGAGVPVVDVKVEDL